MYSVLHALCYYVSRHNSSGRRYHDYPLVALYSGSAFNGRTTDLGALRWTWMIFGLRLPVTSTWPGGLSGAARPAGGPMGTVTAAAAVPKARVKAAGGSAAATLLPVSASTGHSSSFKVGDWESSPAAKWSSVRATHASPRAVWPEISLKALIDRDPNALKGAGWRCWPATQLTEHRVATSWSEPGMATVLELELPLSR